MMLFNHVKVFEEFRVINFECVLWIFFRFYEWCQGVSAEAEAEEIRFLLVGLKQN